MLTDKAGPITLPWQTASSTWMDVQGAPRPDLLPPRVLSEEYYQRLFAVEQAHGWQRGMVSYNKVLLSRLLDNRTGVRVLDSGCGTGGLMAWLRARGASVVGVDLARAGLAFSRQRGQTRLAQGSSMELPFADNSFDLVVCTDVLQHLPNPPGDSAALTESFRVLAPGGYLYLRTNSGCGDSEPIERSATYRKYTRGELARRVAQTGFLVERCTYANCLPAVPMLVRRRLNARRVAGRAHDHDHSHNHGDPGLSLKVRPPGRRWVDHLLAATLRAEARLVGLNDNQIDLPFGDSLLLLARKPAAGAQRRA